MQQDDGAWLRGHAFLLLIDVAVDTAAVRRGVAAAQDNGLAGVVVSPAHLASLGEVDDLAVAAVVGFPTGRHHSLVKAAEARLAVAQGATEVWVSPDISASDANTLLAEFVALREAVPPPVQLSIVAETGLRDAAAGQAVAQAAALAGADRLVTGSGWWPGTGASISLPPEVRLTVTGLHTLDEVLGALESGADRVAVGDLAILLDP
ncbi:Deoxyribose-phosphate aldolase [Corynebacterium atrinae]|uniref:2-deoxyribose-5-phosphate aldolase n=1 Tax=Corynebacterium atrinae TaxID=1336740 RepID=UPI0025B5555B|nr:2-deoxyribose-5-phosphate aldolase [Corynebacterium atrinae]WJY62407.1 Deoxyribose-phosphate aldolase [Corynebacterium atrinae]